MTFFHPRPERSRANHEKLPFTFGLEADWVLFLEHEAPWELVDPDDPDDPNAHARFIHPSPQGGTDGGQAPQPRE